MNYLSGIDYTYNFYTSSIKDLSMMEENTTELDPVDESDTFNNI